LKNFTFLALTASLLFSAAANAQNKPKAPAENMRCATMERLDVIHQHNIGVDEATKLKPRTTPNSTQENYRLTAVVNIPVVVHIVLPNPLAVTDADVQSQIARLNLDFAGLNPDSTNVPPAFAAIRGRSQIQFCLARRTPTGQLTNGIQRRASGAGSNITLATDPIKRFALGGLDAWDRDQYLNLWVGLDASGNGILGYAQFPGTGAAADDGVFLNAQSFGEATCNNIPVYNKGRTGSHEVGHWLGLYHIWGDEGGCTGDDFRQLPNAGPGVPNPYALPGTLANLAGQGNTASDVGDTPNQAGATTNCPSGTATDACATAAPGKMYQNYMDYTADNCYSMFTRQQVARMEWIVDNARAGLKTSLGCQPPAGAILLDAAPASSVNPGGFELIGCTGTSYPSALSCPGNIAPKFRVTNNGLNTITSLTVGYRFNNGPAIFQSVTVNLPTGATQVVSFPAFAVGIGNHSFKFFTSAPNGNVDQVPANDTLTVPFQVLAPVTAPLVEGFESTTFPPTGWTRTTAGGLTWTRTTPGRGTSLGKMSIDNYNVDATGTTQDFRSPAITVDPLKTYRITYDIAHKNYPNFPDGFAILVSTNCGQTFTQIYTASGATLATAGSSTADYATPLAADWVTRSIDIPAALLAGGQIQVAFRNLAGFGNRIHIDNINISDLGSRDLRLASINSPGANACSPNITPSVTVSNEGLETITSFKVGYRIDNGTNAITTFTQTIAPGATATVSLPAGTAAQGGRTITAFTADPVSANGTGDSRTSNDTLSKSFTVVTLANSPTVNDFETALAPPGWSIFNPNNNVTWVRRAPGRNSALSAFFDNFNSNVANQIDDIVTPNMNSAGADSVTFAFDLAHKNYNTGANQDTLTILLSTDCGTTYTPVYKKWGATLATAGASTSNYLAPLATDWRREVINLGPSATAAGSVTFAIRNTNRFGNNIFVDNVNIATTFKRDVQLVSINQPALLNCASSITPSVTLRNNGVETITAVKVSYSLNGGAPATTTVTNLNLVRNATTTVTLNPANTAAGSYVLTVYSWDPVTSSGTGDQNPSNDTLRRNFSVAGIVAAPLFENFDTTTIPPANWSVVNPDGATTWAKANVGNNSSGSAFVRNRTYTAKGQRDDLATPQITYSGVDSVILSFDLSAATYLYPGATDTQMDTLEVLVTSNCGNSFTSVYKKWGAELQTVNDPNSPQDVEFIASRNGNWRNERIDLTRFNTQSPILVLFRATNNNGNNIYLDNVNVSTKVLPAALKQQGFLILPTSFQNSFNIWHVQQPTSLRYVNVFNSAGQRVFSQQFGNNGADKVITVDMTGKAAGMYVVQLGYDDEQRNITQRVFKY
jgi:hypothetical protein